MPHYKDGTEAKIGDVVRGKGYNVEAVIIGTVVGITPGSASCNIQVAHVVTKEFDGAYPDHNLFVQKCVIGCGADGGKAGTPKVGAGVNLEYGQCDAFEKVG